MHKVISAFMDLEDDKYQYEVGDEFPRDGLKVSKERISELSGSENKCGRPLIESVKKKEKPAEGDEDVGADSELHS